MNITKKRSLPIEEGISLKSSRIGGDIPQVVRFDDLSLGGVPKTSRGALIGAGIS